MKTRLTRESFHVLQANARNSLRQSEQVPTIMICAGSSSLLGIRCAVTLAPLFSFLFSVDGCHLQMTFTSLMNGLLLAKSLRITDGSRQKRVFLNGQ